MEFKTRKLKCRHFLGILQMFLCLMFTRDVRINAVSDFTGKIKRASVTF